jgi:hypothetical protein
MDDLIQLLLNAMSTGWGVSLESCVIGPPDAERLSKPYAAVTWATELIERCPGGALDVRVYGIECTYFGNPIGASRGEIAKKEMAAAFMAEITDEQWQNYGLGEVEVRYLDDMDTTVTSEIAFTMAMSAEFTVCG